jgi:hypothetical protein
MSIRTSLRTYLLTITEVAALPGNKVYVGRAPQGSQLPRVEIDRISNDSNNTLTGIGGANTDDFEIDCKAATPSAADDLAEAIRDVIEPFSGAMGDNTCLAVIFEGFTDREEFVDDMSDVSRHVTTLNLQIQYS